MVSDAKPAEVPPISCVLYRLTPESQLIWIQTHHLMLLYVENLTLAALCARIEVAHKENFPEQCVPSYVLRELCVGRFSCQCVLPLICVS